MGSKYINLKRKVVQLRRQGKSYNSIRRELNVRSKGTISYWLKGIRLSASSLRKLQHNNLLAYQRGLFTANQRRSQRIKAENEKSYNRGQQAIRSITVTVRDLSLIGTALYWGEGTKAVQKNSPYLVFTNSDPQMIRVYMNFLRHVLGVEDIKIKAGLHTYRSIDTHEARKFWSGVTGLPRERFYVVQQVSGASRRVRGKRRLPYGTAVIRVNSRLLFYRVMGMIGGLIRSQVRL